MKVANTVYAVIGLAVAVSCCPLAFDWKQQPPEKRASLSPIVAVGYVIKSYRDSANISTTKYAVDFKIVRTLKGDDILRNISQVSEADSQVFRITNFGSKLFCLADLDLGQIYMLFLRVINDGLSAYYTDLFGAAEYWTMEMEEAVIKAIFGYDEWSEWSTCSESCGNKGSQVRKRTCAKVNPDECIGNNTEVRVCNKIKCHGAMDLLELANLRSMERGVIITNVIGQNMYDITPNFHGSIPLKNIFPSSWPDEYSIMGRVRTRKTKYPREGQYLFSVTDATGRRLGLKVFPSPTLEIVHDNNRTSSVSIPLPQENINDGHWHQFAFSVKGQMVAMYYNCYQTISHVLPWLFEMGAIERNTMHIAALSNSSDKGADDRYEGTISQLIITSDSIDASNQCLPESWTEMRQHKTPSSPRENSNYAELLNYKHQDHWEWSAWSECSVSCGVGEQARVPLCRDSRINLDDCIPYYVPKTHGQKCYSGPCTFIAIGCKGGCANGGKCGRRKGGYICKCKKGFTGERCEDEICSLCKNGGSCLNGKKKCFCPSGYIGKLCQHKINPLLCTQNPCKNDGKCIGINKCFCKSAFKGKHCEIRGRKHRKQRHRNKKRVSRLT